MQIGDLLSSHDGQWVPVDDLLDTGEYEQVYNLRIADFHTYFVGTRDWTFSVWSHNTKYEIKVEPNAGGASAFGVGSLGDEGDKGATANGGSAGVAGDSRQAGPEMGDRGAAEAEWTSSSARMKNQSWVTAQSQSKPAAGTLLSKGASIHNAT